MCCEPVLREHPALAPSAAATERQADVDPVPSWSGGPVAGPREPRPLDHNTREVALLLTSELVTNAILHARTPVQLGVLVDNDQALICVADRMAESAALSPRGHSRTRPVRGLALVDDLAGTWGTRATPAADRVVRAQTAGEPVVEDRMIAAGPRPSSPPLPRVETGIPGLDHISLGGLPRGRATSSSGPPAAPRPSSPPSSWRPGRRPRRARRLRDLRGAAGRPAAQHAQLRLGHRALGAERRTGASSTPRRARRAPRRGAAGCTSAPCWPGSSTRWTAPAPTRVVIDSLGAAVFDRDLGGSRVQLRGRCPSCAGWA